VSDGRKQTQASLGVCAAWLVVMGQLVEPLICVVTGLEHSGTTLLSQLFNGHPNIASGHELGFLLSDIHDFDRVQPWYDWIKNENWGWAVTERDRKKLLGASSFREMYSMLNEFKGRNHKNEYLRSLFISSSLIYDKTPSYVYSLQEIMNKIDVPFIVTLKSPLEAIKSYKSKNVNVDGFFKRYHKALVELRGAIERYADRVLVVKYVNLASDPLNTMEIVKKFVGIDDNVRLDLDAYNRRFGKYIVSENTFNNKSIEYVKSRPNLSIDEMAKYLEFERNIKFDYEYVVERSSHLAENYGGM
jgi:hypothetical protein